MRDAQPQTGYPNTQEWTDEQKEDFIRENEPLIRSVVNMYRHIPDPALSADDLFQEASMACWRAFDTYSPTKGTLFTTYVYKLMRNEVNMTIRASNASKRRPPGCILPYDSGPSSHGEEIMGADNLEIPESSMVRAEMSIDDMCARQEILAYTRKLLATKFSAEERHVFLRLSQGFATQNELAKELGCSQAKISMMYSFARITINYELKQAGFSEAD